ncbi:ECF RNA polymerase sigma factor SigW [mine drainage metagenome]|uniref:ECF RNA polymerase sigma factor SigW n=1 Tax=mine drainage metagenome TaxID=410659 RepID=A0A1J5R836_9ZZZZ
MNKMLSLPPGTAAPPPGTDDDVLLERMRDDDVEAYRALVERHMDRAFGVAMRVLKNTSDAEDVTQDAFVKAWLNRHKWEPGRARFSTWLYRVVVNRCIDLRRAPRQEWIDDVPEPMDEGEDSVSSIHRRQVYGRLEDALGRLPTQQRVAVVLSYYEDLSNAEIAEVMNSSVSAVESLLKRGRKGLRDILKTSEQDVKIVFGD